MEVGGRCGLAFQSAIIGILILEGCQSTPREAAVSDVAGRRARAIAEQRLADAQSPDPAPPEQIPSRMIGPTDTQPAGTLTDIAHQVPDPLDVPDALRSEYNPENRPPGMKIDVWKSGHDRYSADVIRRLVEISRPRQVRLSLAEVIRRTLRNSYAIEIQSYNPAIETTNIVEAEAQFDAVFFANYQYNKQDRPTASELVGTLSDTRSYSGGIRKLLSTGMQVEVAYNMVSTRSNLPFQTLNPSYFNQFSVQFTQPLLRNFGIDYNRSRIDNARLERQKSIEALSRNIRETLFNAEQAYWRLFQARRNVAITARLLSNLDTIFYSLQQRFEVGFDVYKVLIQQTKSRIENRKAQFVRFRNDVMNAEDALKRLMNDPQLNQAANIEIIPTEVPTINPMIVDQLGELTAALSNRAELHEARITIEQAQIAIGVAKNQALPRLDLLFRYVVDGLGSNASSAFKQMSNNDFHEYVLQLSFEWPIGDRGPEAALRRARLQQAQAIAANRDAIEQVITEVNTAIRDLQSSYDQIGPSIRGAQASQEQLRATIIRAEERTPPTLQVELDANDTLANQRQQLLQVLADYNIALINLERQKGTLLEYNNVVIRGANEDNYLDPYRPIGP